MSRQAVHGWRVDPQAARQIRAAVEGRVIAAHGVSNALGDALQAIRNAGDVDTDRVIHALAGIEADLHDATARIDARVATASRALAQVVSEIEGGDDAMAEQMPTVQQLLGAGAREERPRP